MDLSEPENRREPNYSRTRFEPSGAPAPSILRMLDGHIMPYEVEMETTYDNGVDLANIYDCEADY